MRSRFWYTILVLQFAFLSIVPPTCQADGKFLPATIEAPPSLPQQRAIIAFDGKKETLVVESTMQAEKGDRFVWILPLPAPPTAIEKTSASGLNTLQFCYGPKIENYLDVDILVSSISLLFSILLAFSIYIRSKWKFGVTVTIFVLGILGWLLIVPNFLTGSSLSFQSASHLSATALFNEQVGNYEVAVLEAQTDREVDDWLKKNQYSTLPKDSTKIVNDYLSEKWVILAAKLRREKKGLLTPHPLKVTFPASRPIYPMRLTGTGKNKVDLELNVIAPERYSCPKLKTVFAEKYNQQGEFNSFMNLNPLLNNKELKTLVTDNGWVNRLRGKLSPRDMKEDFVLDVHPQQSSYRQTLYTPGAAARLTFQWLSILLAAILPLLALLSIWRQKIMRKALPYVIGAVLAAGILIYFLYPVAYSTRSYRGLRDLRTMSTIAIYEIEEAIKPYESFVEAEKKARRVLSKQKNPFTGEPIREEQSPGNFELTKTKNGGLDLTFYSSDCSPGTWTIIESQEPEPPPNFIR